MFNLENRRLRENLSLFTTLCECGQAWASIFTQAQQGAGQREMTSSCTRIGLDCIDGKSSLKGLSDRVPREEVESPFLVVFKRCGTEGCGLVVGLAVLA